MSLVAIGKSAALTRGSSTRRLSVALRDRLVAALGRDGHHRIAHVPRRAVRARHVPAAPSLLERRPVIHDRATELRPRAAGRLGEHAAHEDAGHAETVRGEMARETAIRAHEARRRAQANFLRQRLEDHTLAWIVRRRFEHRRAGNVADNDAIVEVQRARVFRIREGMLDTGLGEQQDLRFHRHVQRREQRPQEAEAALELERCRSRRQIALQSGDRIRQCARAIVDRRMLIECAGKERPRLGRREGQRARPAERRLPPTPSFAERLTALCARLCIASHVYSDRSVTIGSTTAARRAGT